VVASVVPSGCAAALPPRPPAEPAGNVVAEGRCAQLCWSRVGEGRSSGGGWVRREQ
jgi:hypothetical protein